MFIKRLKKRYWIALGIVLLLVVGIAARRNYVQRFNEGELAYAYEVARSLGFDDAARLAIEDTGCGALAFGHRCISIAYDTPLSVADFTTLMNKQRPGNRSEISPFQVFDLDRILVDGRPGKNHINGLRRPSAWMWWRSGSSRSVEIKVLELARDTTHSYTIDGTPVRGNLVTIFLSTRRPYF